MTEPTLSERLDALRRALDGGILEVCIARPDQVRDAISRMPVSAHRRMAILEPARDFVAGLMGLFPHARRLRLALSARSRGPVSLALRVEAETLPLSRTGGEDACRARLDRLAAEMGRAGRAGGDRPGLYDVWIGTTGDENMLRVRATSPDEARLIAAAMEGIKRDTSQEDELSRVESVFIAEEDQTA